jgi:hypothetical protein
MRIGSESPSAAVRQLESRPGSSLKRRLHDPMEPRTRIRLSTLGNDLPDIGQGSEGEIYHSVDHPLLEVGDLVPNPPSPHNSSPSPHSSTGSPRDLPQRSRTPMDLGGVAAERKCLQAIGASEATEGFTESYQVSHQELQ